MAVSTYTSSIYEKNPPKAPHIANTSVVGKFTWPAAGTVGDVVFLCKVPHGARIIDAYEYHSNGQTAAVLDFGFSRGVASGGAGNLSCVISGGALATMNRMSLAAAPGSSTPVQISLSDTDPIRYTAFACTAVSGTFTISVSISFGLTYAMDGM